MTDPAQSSSIGRPLVSVVIPTRNRRKMFERAVHSVLLQDVDVELVVIELDSVDDTHEFLDGLHDDRIRRIRIDQCPPGRARNLAAAAAKGRWLAFLDDDDFWGPGRLRAHVAALVEHDANWGDAATFYFDDDGRVTGLRRPFVGSATQLLLALTSGNPITSTSTVIVDREFFLEVGGFDESLRFGEDWMLWLDLAASGRWFGLEQPLCATRVGFGSASAAPGEINQTLASLAAHRNKLGHLPGIMSPVASWNLLQSVAYLRANSRVRGAYFRARAAMDRRSVRDLAIAGATLVLGPRWVLNRASKITKTTASVPEWLTGAVTV